MVWPTSEHARPVTTSRDASGSSSAWAASGMPATLRANSMIRCWKPPQVPSSGRSRVRAQVIASSAPRMLRYGLAGAIQIASKEPRTRSAAPSMSGVAIQVTSARQPRPRAEWSTTAAMARWVSLCCW